MRYFLNFRKCAYESLLQHRNILRKSEKHFCEVLWIRCTFSLKIQFVIMFGLTLGPDFEIFSQFLEMRLWISSSASQCLAKKRKTFLWGFVDPMHLFIKDSICHNVWPNFGPRFWDIFSISGNALMNHFFWKSEKRLWGYADQMQLFIKDSIFHNVWPNFGPRFWDIFSISGNALVNHFFAL